jgi:oligopeptide transport system ATP-binding protein
MEKLLKVKDLVKHFPIRDGLFSRQSGRIVHAVNGISFEIEKGETLGIVGESGCGKSTLGRSILRLIEPDSGEVIFKGEDILKYDSKKMRQTRREMQIIFQDPYSSLNPRMNVGRIVGEPLSVHKIARGKEATERVDELLRVVGLTSEMKSKYPHEFSGGQRQRIGIARAIALNPSFIVADEPVSSLDVSIQAQIINLLMEIQAKYGLAYLFISHDLNVVEHISKKTLVMYLGKTMELLDSKQVKQRVLHPYSKALVSAIPIPDPKTKIKKMILKGDVPNPINPPSGCVFHTRCPIAIDRCKAEIPQLLEKAPNHFTACHLV